MKISYQYTLRDEIDSLNASMKQSQANSFQSILFANALPKKHVIASHKGFNSDQPAQLILTPQFLNAKVHHYNEEDGFNQYRSFFMDLEAEAEANYVLENELTSSYLALKVLREQLRLQGTSKTLTFGQLLNIEGVIDFFQRNFKVEFVEYDGEQVLPNKNQRVNKRKNRPPIYMNTQFLTSSIEKDFVTHLRTHANWLANPLDHPITNLNRHYHSQTMMYDRMTRAQLLFLPSVRQAYENYYGVRLEVQPNLDTQSSLTLLEKLSKEKVTLATKSVLNHPIHNEMLAFLKINYKDIYDDLIKRTLYLPAS